MNKRCCFIGHRRIGFGPIRERLEQAVKIEINNGCKFFTMGTHGEFDTLALDVCKMFRAEIKDVEIEVVLTSLNKIKKQLIFEDAFGKVFEIPYSDVKTVMFDMEQEHFKRKITLSNRIMLDSCDIVICYVDKRKIQSGAKSALNYAMKKGLKIINLYDEKDEPTYGMSKDEKDYYYKNFFKKMANDLKKLRD